MTKLYDLITWHNNTNPALNEDNLNSMSQAIDKIDDRVVELATDILVEVPKINEKLSQADAYVAQAKESADAAATSASRADTFDHQSEEWAGKSKEYSESASSYASDARSASGNAVAYASAANRHAINAENSATAAASSASAAATSATNAATSETNAGNSASAAASSASAAAASAQLAQDWSAHPPYIGANGNWWVYDTSTESFVDSTIDASITVQIADVTMLDPDADPYVTNTGTDTDPVFHLFVPRGRQGDSGTPATTSVAGVVKPDGTTITVEADGTIHGASSGMAVDGSNAAEKVAFAGSSFTVGTREVDASNPSAYPAGKFSTAFGIDNVASGSFSHAEGDNTQATKTSAHAEGHITQATGAAAHSEGGSTTASSGFSHAEGHHTYATGNASHAEGNGYNDFIQEGDSITASGAGAHAEGYAAVNGSIVASGDGAHAEGYVDRNGENTLASGIGSHAEGNATTASAKYAHAEGSGTTASGNSAHAEGANTTVSGMFSHAEGYYSTATGGNGAHAEGCYAKAVGASSHAEGFYTTAGYNYQHVQGKYNSNKTDTLFEIGNGTGETARSNAFEVYANGNINFTGDLYMGGVKKDFAAISVTTTDPGEGSALASGTLLVVVEE